MHSVNELPNHLQDFYRAQTEALIMVVPIGVAAGIIVPIKVAKNAYEMMVDAEGTKYLLRFEWGHKKNYLYMSSTSEKEENVVVDFEKNNGKFNFVYLFVSRFAQER